MSLPLHRVLALLLVSFTAVGSSAAAQAQAGLFAGLSVYQLEYREGGAEAEPSAVSINVGYQFSANFSLEARAGSGLADDSVRIFGEPASMDVDNFVGAYAKFLLPLTSSLSAYGLAGYTYGKVEARGNSSSIKVSEGDITYGAGVDFRLGDHLIINAELARLMDTSDTEIDALSVGLRYAF